MAAASRCAKNIFPVIALYQKEKKKNKKKKKKKNKKIFEDEI